jgi:hypothetical protein
MRETCFIGIPIRDGVFDAPIIADLACEIRRVKSPTSKELLGMRLVVSRKGGGRERSAVERQLVEYRYEMTREGSKDKGMYFGQRFGVVS